MSRMGRGDLRRRGREVTRSMIRRLRVAASDAVHWVLEGFEDFDGNVETEEAEAFEGIGFASRPKADHRAEVVVAKIGGESGHPVIVASRSRDAFKLLTKAEGLEEDETVIFTSKSMVKIKADGEILIGSIGGTFKALATADHKHGPGTFTTPSGGNVTGESGASDDNTTKLKAE